MPMKDWHTTAAENASAGTITWAEGQLPSTVNNSARQMMSDGRTWYEDPEWYDYGYTISRVDSLTFKVTGDVTAKIMAGRRIRGTGTSIMYGVVENATYAAPDTTVVVLPDSYYLDASLSAIAVHILTPAGSTSLVGPSYEVDVITNPGMDIAQGLQTFTFVTAGSWVIDGYLLELPGTQSSTWRVERISSGPSVQLSGYHIANSLGVTNLATEDVVATGDYSLISQKIEGYNAREVAGRPFAVGFWCYSTVTGTYSIAARNGGANRSCVRTFDVSTSSTWEWKNVAFGTATQGGTWYLDNSVGIHLSWCLLGTAPFAVAPSMDWVTGNFVCVTAQANLGSVLSSHFRLTGVTMAVGGQAPRYRPRPVGEVLDRCQRYYQKSYNLEVVPGTSSGPGCHALVVENIPSVQLRPSDNVRFSVRMRTTPTVTVYSVSGVASAYWDNIQNINVSATVGFQGEMGFHTVAENELTASESHGLLFQWTADSRL